MILRSIYLAAEDSPGLAVGHKLVAEAPPLKVYREENGHGFGTLRRKVASFAQMTRSGFPVLLLTDLDRASCPPSLIHNWLGVGIPSEFLFRVCVREIEAWLLGHREAIAEFLHIAPSKIPYSPESLPDPKATLIRLAQKSPRQIREGLTPAGSASIGPRYNDLLVSFIHSRWDPHVASGTCSSLAKARIRLAELAAKVEN